MSAPSILLRNATILVPGTTESKPVAAVRNHSLLVEGNKIVRIAAHIDAPSDKTQVIDCTGKIVSPGFIDTHHHVWQTQLKGRHADHSLLEYVPAGNMQSFNYTPEDIFWGELGGCLEALNAGTTTVVDHAHMNYSPAHTASSGIRSTFCYAPTTRVKQWEPEITVDTDFLPRWAVEQVEELIKAGPYGGGRETVTDLYQRCRQAGAKVITTHYCRGAIFGQHSIVDMLEGHGVLGPDILLSHATNLTDADAKKLSEVKASISSTPDTEIQMGLGYPVCFRDDTKSISSLGVDCHSNNGSSLINQMRLGLQAERGLRNSALIEAGKAPKHLTLSVQEVFRLGTIGGARAIGMEDQLGSLEEGKLADIVIFDGLTPGMICASEEDPVAAVVLHSSIADIETVIVDGRIVKQRGSLVPVDLDLSLSDLKPAKTRLEWPDIAQELLKSRQRVIQAGKKSWGGDMEKALDGVTKLFYIDPNNLV
ncbi:amidohydrolase family domain-containing protein [Trichoderma breve]|uniref:Amidohydrolase family domain-containing protein n=1 Tax=Trichoderma breve TaxID=2034170 RepID=A0A9W9EAL1_9HYPO|nr:amidohydrolase family domain-containing protein [Trichoderma breve]KAJ4863171.1 amidohydrolase family domain-containing protein [Trichoderma breve]